MDEKEKGIRQFNSTLRRRKKLECKTFLKRSEFARSKNPKDHRAFAFEAKSTAKPKKNGLKNISKKQKKALTKRYFPAHRAFLKLSENRFCWICIARSLDATREEVRNIMTMPFEESARMLLASGARCTPATEVHHVLGRCGRLLDYVPGFLSSCSGCREFPHVNKREARRLHLLAPASEYDVFPFDKVTGEPLNSFHFVKAEVGENEELR